MVRLVEGQIVADEEGDGGAAGGGVLGRVLRCRGGTTINFLGFRVPLYWTCVAAVFATLRFGAPGLLFVGVVAGKERQRVHGGLHRAMIDYRCVP